MEEVNDDDDLSTSMVEEPAFTNILAKRAAAAAAAANKALTEETRMMIHDQRHIAHQKEDLEELCKDILFLYFNNKVKHFFGPEYGEIDICQEVFDVCAKRTDLLADREKGLDGASRAVKGCIMHTITKAKEVLANSDAMHYHGDLALKKTIIQIETFDEKNQKDWSPVILALLKDNENRKELEHHQRENYNITTLDVTIGEDTLSSSILSCANSSYSMYVETDKIVLCNYDKNKECHKAVRDYKTAIDEIFKEPDLERRMVLKAELDKNYPIPEIKKRKRLPQPLPKDSPLLRKRLKTKHEAELLELEEEKKDETEIDIRPIIIIKSDRVPKQEPKGRRECECCDKNKPLLAFYNQSKSYAYLRNVCHTCITQKKKVDKAHQ
jgi:hypothetical protein